MNKNAFNKLGCFVWVVALLMIGIATFERFGIKPSDQWPKSLCEVYRFLFIGVPLIWVAIALIVLALLLDLVDKKITNNKNT